jgi:diguanylate cyclase (GGDEF)-like protein/PAS domain S-box-containing protein
MAACAPTPSATASRPSWHPKTPAHARAHRKPFLAICFSQPLLIVVTRMPRFSLSLVNRLWWLGVFAVVLLAWLGAFAYTAAQLRQKTLDDALDATRLYAHSLEDHLTQTLLALELTSHTLQEQLGGQLVLRASIERQLEQAVRSMPAVRSLSIADANGHLLYSSNPRNTGRLANTVSMYPPADLDLPVLRIGQPVPARDWAQWDNQAPAPAQAAAAEHRFVPVYLPFALKQQTLFWVVALNTDHFQTQAALLFDTDGLQADWVRYDGAYLWGSAEPPSAGARAGVLGRWLKERDFASLHTQDPSLGAAHLLSYRASSRYPLAVSVWLPEDVALQPWVQDTQQRALYLAPLLLLLSLLGWLLWAYRARLQAQQAVLQEQRQLAQQVVTHANDAIVVTNASGCIESVNPAFEAMTGYSAQQCLGQNARLLGSGQQPRAFFQQLFEQVLSQGYWEGQIVNRRADGSLYTARMSISVIRDEHGQVQHFAGILADITARQRAEEALKLAASVFSHAQEAILITDPQGTIIDVNAALSFITGYTREEVIGRNTRMFSSGRQSKQFYKQLWDCLKTEDRWSGEIWNRRKSGEVYAELLTISAIKDADGQVLRYVAMFSDITRIKEHEQRLERMAHFDILTGLPNRALLSDRLELAMTQVQRRGKTLAVVFLDLDGFKSINDLHGHDAGDQLLIALSQRMKQALRDGDTISRIGGDEFVAVLQDLDNPQDCLPVLERLRTSLGEPAHVAGYGLLQVSASLGIAFYPQVEDIGSDQLLRQADQAMYQAKISGKNRYHVFDALRDQSLRERNESLNAIRRALERHEFVLHYQPKVNMRTGQVLGVEALVRWQHPQRGLLSPVHFLPTLKNHPLALTLGQWVMDEALAQIVRWKAQDLPITVSINLDAEQLTADLVPMLKAALARHPSVNPADVRLEVLESSALNDLDEVSVLIRECQALGVAFSLDDFGTGYSSLTYLRRLPAQELKIDQSFVRNMLADPDDLAILQGVMGLARAFHRHVVAEGVETTALGCMLLRMGCENAQGYAIAKPMPASELVPWFHQWSPPPEWLGLSRLSTDHQLLLFALAEIRRCHNSQQPPPLSHMQAVDLHIQQWMQALAPQHPCRQQPSFLQLQQLLQQLQQHLHTHPLYTASNQPANSTEPPPSPINPLCHRMEAALTELIENEL